MKLNGKDIYLSFLKGDKGDLGPRGEKGDTALSVKVGTVTTSKAGTTAKVTNRGTNTDLILDFNIPKGDQGAQGIQGPKGDSGVASGVVLSNTYDNSDENGYTKKAVNNLVSNPNLLINGDFQIRKTNIPEMWTIGSNATLQLDESGITYITTGASNMGQVVDVPFYTISGKTVTLSVKMNGKIYSSSAIVPSDKPTTTGETAIVNFRINENGINGYLKFVWINNSGVYRAYMYFASAQTVKIDYMKLEMGAVATTYSPNVVETYLTNNMPSNPNLLTNGDFRVNQRGEPSYTSADEVYTVDRWKKVGSTTIVTPIDTGLNITCGESGASFRMLYQKLEQDFTIYEGKSVALSAYIRSITNTNLKLGVEFYSDDFTTRIAFSETYITQGFNSTTLVIPANAKKCRVYIYKTSTGANDVNIDYIKLETGSVATANSPRPYAEELALCKRYFQRIAPSLNYGTFCTGGCTSANETYVGSGIYTTNFWFELPLSVEMRKNPTFSYKGGFKILCEGVYISVDESTTINDGLGRSENYKSITIKKDLGFNVKGSFATLRSDETNEYTPAVIDLDAEL